MTFTHTYTLPILPAMIECKFRIPVNSNNNTGIGQAMLEAVRKSIPGVDGAAVVGNLRQSFDCGLCELLTQNDIGPVACLQPEHSEETCPDIAHLSDQLT